MGSRPACFKPVLEALQSFRRKGDMHLLVRDRQNRAQHDMIAAGREPHDLPVAGEFLGKFRDRQVLDQDAEQSLVQVVREIEFFAAPNRSKPGFGHQEQHRFAAVRRLVERRSQRSPAAMPRCGSRSRKISSFQPLSRQPVAQRDRLGIVCARMAQKNARHNRRPEGTPAPRKT